MTELCMKYPMSLDGICMVIGYGAVLVVLPVMGIIGWIKSRNR